jgi:hypothetical protein
MWLSDCWTVGLSDCRPSHQMDQVEQRIVLKFLFVKSLGYNAAHREFCLVLGEGTYSLWQMKRWICRFRNGDLSCEDEDRPGTPLSDLGDGIRRHLAKFPFTSAKAPARHFSTLVSVIRGILKTHLGFQKLSRRWVAHELTFTQKRRRCEIAEMPLNVLRNEESARFSHVATGDECWLSHHYQSTHCYAKFRLKVPLRTKPAITPKRTIITIFLIRMKFMALDDLPREQKFDKNHFLSMIPP